MRTMVNEGVDVGVDLVGNPENRGVMSDDKRIKLLRKNKEDLMNGRMGEMVVEGEEVQIEVEAEEEGKGGTMKKKVEGQGEDRDKTRDTMKSMVKTTGQEEVEVTGLTEITEEILMMMKRQGRAIEEEEGEEDLMAVMKRHMRTKGKTEELSNKKVMMM